MRMQQHIWSGEPELLKDLPSQKMQQEKQRFSREEEPMIDEKKIERELNRGIAREPESPQSTLLKGFLEYISRQPVINVREAYFRQRMAAVMMTDAIRVLVEVE